MFAEPVNRLVVDRELTVGLVRGIDLRTQNHVPRMLADHRATVSHTQAPDKQGTHA